MRSSRAAVLVASLFLLLSCGEEPHVQPPLSPLSEGEPLGRCSAVVRSYQPDSAAHHAECSEIEYATSPPVSGDHYPSWAAYQTYSFPVPLGYLVHDLEHGAVVYFYDCPDGCTDELAEAQAMIDALPDDPRCSEDVRVQVILVPRPGLGSRWAASAWGYSLNADCFDAAVFRQFYRDHHGQGPEDLCNQGVAYPKDPCD